MLTLSQFLPNRFAITLLKCPPRFPNSPIFSLVPNVPRLRCNAMVDSGKGEKGSVNPSVFLNLSGIFRDFSRFSLRAGTHVK